MSGERTYPVLPCADLESALTFYRALGFDVSFLQLRPYPCAVVSLEDLHIHLSEIAGFDPAGSYASAVITVPDPGALYESFRDGLRQQFTGVPTVGIPRLLPVRKKAGTATGFSVVDVGGNWLRFYRTGATEEEPTPEARKGLGRVVEVAARQGDARGDEAQAITVLDAGLLRYLDAPAAELFEAVLYRAELKIRIGADGAEDLATATALAAQHGLGQVAEDELARVREALTS